MGYIFKRTYKTGILKFIEKNTKTKKRKQKGEKEKHSRKIDLKNIYLKTNKKQKIKLKGKKEIREIMKSNFFKKRPKDLNEGNKPLVQ